MPESKTRKAADAKKKANREAELAERRVKKQRTTIMPGQRAWVPPLFITVGLIGVAWLVVYYIAGFQIPGMKSLGNWNIAIGMGLMAAAFGIATLWK